MTQKVKRALSLFMAAVLCCAALLGLGTTAYAAREQGTVYQIAFPRSGDENYSGAWGHDAAEYMNGWSVGQAKHTSVLAIGSYNSSICYCIEPGVEQKTGYVFSKWSEDFWSAYPAAYNKTISAETIKLMIGRIFEYGYTGTISTSWRSTNEGAENLSNAVATQLLIWETIVGERDRNFQKVSTGGKSGIASQISSAHPLRDKIMSYYHHIEQNVQNHVKLPSFLSDSRDSAPTTALAWDGNKYTATLEDKNNVLADYAFSAENANIHLSVNGNKLVITADAPPAGSVGITASRRNSQRRGVITWSDGKIGPNGERQDIVTFGENMSDPVSGYMSIKVSYGSAKIVKTSEDEKIAGVSFTVEGSGINKTVKTNSRGEIQIDNLAPGIYTVTEQSYDPYKPQAAQRVTVIAGQTATVTFNNTLKRGSLTVTKTSEDGLNEGMTFHLYGTSLAGLAVDEYAVTDSSGKARFENVLIGSGYTLEEVNTPYRYVMPEKQSAAVEWNTVTQKSFTNILKKWSATVTKSDRETGTAQGDADLSGAVYGVFKGNQLVDRYTTDANGQFTTDYYVCGSDWTVREITPSPGYLLDNTVYRVGADAKQYELEYNSTTLSVLETIAKGKIALIKHADNGDTQIETPEAGAEFSVYLKKSGSYDAAMNTERDYLICDKNGYAETKSLPYGVYTVHQVKGTAGSELLPDFDVFICEDGQIYRYLANNARFRSYLKIVKADAETGKTIPASGAGFQIYRPDGSLITQRITYPEPTEIDTFYTNADGMLYTPERLEYGKGYSLVEVAAPYGYVLDSNPVYFDITPENADDKNGLIVIEVTKENTPQKGIIQIEKSSEVFSSVVQTDNIYQPVYSVMGLPGAVYEITAAEDITTPDGTLRLAAGELADRITTDETGIAKSKPLYLGKYEVKEVAAPYGMTLCEESSLAELTYAGQEITVTQTAASFLNERQKAVVTLEKSMQQDDRFRIGGSKEITAVTFGLFAFQTLTAADGTQIPADALLEIVSVNENDYAQLKTDLPFGSYYLKELATDGHYLLSDAVYPIVFEYAGQDTALVEIKANDGQPIDNTLIYGEINGRKTDDSGNGLAGAKIGLFRPDETVFNEDTAILTALSDENGSFSFDAVPRGNWLVRELAAPTGYLLCDRAYSVFIEENGAVVELEIVNVQIRGSVQTTKTDRDYPDTTLTGAEFTVYRDTDSDGKLTDEMLGTLAETSPGVYEMSDLAYGSYFLKETKAPQGFRLDETAYAFSISEHGKTVVVETEAGKGFVNAAQTGNLHIQKTSDDNALQGFTFKVEGTDITGRQFYKEYVTDEKGEIRIDGLRVGEYTISELSNKATEKYILPDAVTVAVENDRTVSAAFHNTLKPTPPPTDSPQTGDNSHTGLWLALAALSLGSLCTLTAANRHSKKSNTR